MALHLFSPTALLWDSSKNIVFKEFRLIHFGVWLLVLQAGQDVTNLMNVSISQYFAIFPNFVASSDAEVLTGQQTW